MHILLLHHLAMQRWEDHSLDYMGTFVGRVMSLLFSTLSKFVIAFLPRRDHLLTSWLESPSAVILEPKKRKSVTTSTFSLSICHEAMGLDAMILVLFCLMFSFKLAVLFFPFTDRCLVVEKGLV